MTDSSIMEIEFAEWLEQQLKERNWDQAELVRRTQIDSGQVSRILNHERNASPGVCIAIAAALNLSREEVFVARGWLRKNPNRISHPDPDPRIADFAGRLQGWSPTLLDQVMPLLVLVADTVEKTSHTK